MKKYLVDYYETYSKSYEIEANSKEEAEDILKYEIQEGKLDGPECCDNSWCEVTEMELSLIHIYPHTNLQKKWKV